MPSKTISMTFPQIVTAADWRTFDMLWTHLNLMSDVKSNIDYREVGFIGNVHCAVFFAGEEPSREEIRDKLKHRFDEKTADAWFGQGK